MIWPTVMRGDSDPNGSWKTSCSSRRSGRIASRSSFEMSRSPKRMTPSLGSSRSSARPSVDLPEPDSPTMPMVCPRFSASETPIDRAQHQRLAAQEAAADLERHLDIAALEQDRRAGRGGALLPVGSAASSILV